MIIVSQCVKKVKGNIIEIHSKKKVICPVCKGDVLPHGKCIRRLVTENKKRKLSLRVWYCPECKHSHREIPRCIIPYKRYSAKVYAKIYDSELSDTLPVRNYVSLANRTNNLFPAVNFYDIPLDFFDAL